MPKLANVVSFNVTTVGTVGKVTLDNINLNNSLEAYKTTPLSSSSGKLSAAVSDKDTDVSATKLTDDGYLILPNGFILQWGQETAATGSETVTFPIPFPNECLNVTCTDYASGDTDGITSATGIKTLPTKTTVIFTCYSTVDTFFWQAIGY